ncbi:adenylosuccinate synthetase [Firmicutes bacterium CAG:449]|nr:adenylosuccinate synthetase [Firmicutes bacterium CAG:449]
MSIVVCEGSQWGDEGKGKITDYLAQQADVVVRFQGGNNAGHTIVFNGHKYALRLIPSGIFSENTKNVLANGMVINPEAFFEELKMIEDAGFKNYKLFISNRAHVIMPYHIDLDGAIEEFLSDSKIGTTKKGIGPCYTDKASRVGIRIGDLIDEEQLKNRLKTTLAYKNMELQMFHKKTYDYDEMLQKCLKWGKQLKPFICDTSVLLNEEIKKNSKILFEGAQGAMLCLDHGTYPYVTSSSPTASSIPVNCGIPPYEVKTVLGIAKSYTTRVGEGPFPSELKNELGDLIRERGHEYGTVTKRPRRIGYLDTVVLNHAIRVSGIKYLSIMLFDVLSNIDNLKICYAYELDGKVINYIPSTLNEYQRCKPIYIDMPSWKEDISKVTSYEELPENAKKYLKKIEELTNKEIAIFSVGPDRTQTIVLKDLFGE